MKFQSQDLLLNQSLENLVTYSGFCISSICFSPWCLCETSVLCSGSVEQRQLEVVFYWWQKLEDREVRQILRPVIVKVGTKWGSQMFELFYMLWNKESILWDTYVKDAMWCFNKDFFFRTFLWCFLKPNLKRKKLMFWGDSGCVFLWAFVGFPVGPLMELISLAVQFFSYCIFKDCCMVPCEHQVPPDE